MKPPADEPDELRRLLQSGYAAPLRDESAVQALGLRLERELRATRWKRFRMFIAASLLLGVLGFLAFGHRSVERPPVTARDPVGQRPTACGSDGQPTSPRSDREAESTR